MKRSILILLAIFMCSCTAVPVQVAEPLAPGSYQEMGRNSCKKCSFLLIDVIPIKFSSMSKRAYDCAASGGDGLMNPDVSESYYMIPYAGTIMCTTVSGTVVKKQASASQP